MRLKKWWTDLGAHPIWSNVAATLIAGLIAYILASAFKFLLAFQYHDIRDQVLYALSLKTEVHVYRIFFFIALVVFILFYKRNNKARNNNLRESPGELNKPLSAADKANTKDSRFVFDSSSIDGAAFHVYGQKLWDNSKGLVGEEGYGNWELKNGILMIERLNIAGRFIIELRQYYPNPYLEPTKKQFVSKNLYRSNPRSFQVLFQSRSIKGKHKIVLVTKRYKSTDWILSLNLEIEEPNWAGQAAGFNVAAHEDFTIELHTFMLSNNPGIIQIKDMTIKETTR